MTREELEVAQFLKGVHDYSQTLADRLDPERKSGMLKPCGKAFVVSRLDSIVVDARQAFWRMTERFPEQVRTVELNAETPAEWVKAAPGLRGE